MVYSSHGPVALGVPPGAGRRRTDPRTIMFKPLKSHHSSQHHSPERATTSDLAEGGEPLGPKLAEPPRGGLLGFLRARPKPVGDTFRTNPRRKSSIRAR